MHSVCGCPKELCDQEEEFSCRKRGYRKKGDSKEEVQWVSFKVAYLLYILV